MPAESDAVDISDSSQIVTWARNRDFEKLKRGIKRGANIEAKDRSGYTALHEAADHGYLEIARYLVEQKANIESRDQRGDTALAWAAYSGHFDVVQYLVEEARAKINTENVKGRTPLYWAMAGHRVACNKIADYLRDQVEKRYIKRAMKAATRDLDPVYMLHPLLNSTLESLPPRVEQA
mmetsp:Transcript_17459/g.33122  ORF Transcript_17459/g.33122 Transcript_17459/m.33122 type:complete len:179 (-) Transcript_17459:142-678(-)